MFSQFKGHLRKIRAQIAPTLYISEALSTVTPAHARAHFRHCGYACEEEQAGGEEGGLELELTAAALALGYM
jgi:hypothetical protein